MAEFFYQLKIPKSRIAVLIGKEGDVKKQIEAETKTKITVDSNEGDVSLTGEDGLSLFSTREVISAIGRGFNPNIAMLLLKSDYSFEQIDLSDHITSKNSLIRMKGRIIGKAGKSRKLIQELSGSYISIYGKTIGIIGEPENTMMARKAIELLLKGSMHSTVYRWLEKKRKEIKESWLVQQ
ncbi:RNA-processing protein [Candidatus Woesearchaeota archaeon]|nr:RNA-processing protein [Candidatus Woesearchaeota archaeon]